MFKNAAASIHLRDTLLDCCVSVPRIEQAGAKANSDSLSKRLIVIVQLVLFKSIPLPHEPPPHAIPTLSPSVKCD